MRMPRSAKSWIAGTLVCLLSWAVVPGFVSAQQELEIETDARLEGYGETMTMTPGNNAMTWMGFGFLAAITLLGLFKDAKRSHLD